MLAVVDGSQPSGAELRHSALFVSRSFRSFVLIRVFLLRPTLVNPEGLLGRQQWLEPLPVPPQDADGVTKVHVDA